MNDSYSINKAFDCTIGTCEKVGFDEKTKTATFMIKITNTKNRDINGEKITFIVSNFMSHKEEWNNIKLPVLFEEISKNDLFYNIILQKY